MSILRTGVAIAGAAALLVALVGCGAAAKPVSDSRTSTASLRAESLMPDIMPSPSSSLGAPMVSAPARPKVPQPSPYCKGNAAGVHHLYVSIAHQHLWACDGAYLYTDSPVTTGAWKLTNVNDATPVGTFRVYAKMRNVQLRGHDANGSWDDHVAYWMPFTGPYGFHDASWQNFPFGDLTLYKKYGSHGCVHLPTAKMAMIFNWSPIGTLVTITHT